MCGSILSCRQPLLNLYSLLGTNKWDGLLQRTVQLTVSKTLLKRTWVGSKNQELCLLCGPLWWSFRKKDINVKTFLSSFKNKSLFLVRSFAPQRQRRESYLWIPHLSGILSLPLGEIWHSPGGTFGTQPAPALWSSWQCTSSFPACQPWACPPLHSLLMAIPASWACFAMA